jgi:hypothetical protein
MDQTKLYKYYRFDPDEHWAFPLHLHGLYFESFDNFNDPYECNFKVTTKGEFQAKKEIVRNWKQSSECQLEIESCRNDQELSKFYKEIHLEHAFLAMRQNLVKDVKVTCFSRAPDIVLMWSHYTQSHGGFCIEFDVEALGAGMSWAPINYVCRRPEMSIFEPPPTQWFLQHKFNDWAYEKEVRAYSPFRQKYFPATAMTGLYLGAKSLSAKNQPNLIKLKKFVDNFSPHLKSKLKMAKLHRENFEIVLSDYSFESLENACRVLA